MTTKTITIKATDVALDIINKRDTGTPLGWVDSIVTKIKARVPANELDTVMVTGLEGVAFHYTHTLTEAEKQAEQLARLTAQLERIKSMMPREDSLLTAYQVAQLKQILG